jgi:hypothetical protein
VEDSSGRPIHFDVQIGGADVQGYASVLDRALHGDEIRLVEIAIVSESRVADECGADALACYRWSSSDAQIVVPNLPAEQVRPSLLHEYGHHVDASYAHLGGARGLDGTAGWWRVRAMAGHLSAGRVAWDYSLGWDRAIAEVFAEDYKLANLPGAGYKIGWLTPPTATVVDAIRTDLRGGSPTTDESGSGTTRPPGASSGTRDGGRFARSRFRVGGRLAGDAQRRIRFPVRSVRRITLTVSALSGGVVRAGLRCGGRHAGGGTARPGAPARIVASRVSPSSCRIALRAGERPVRYRVAVVKTRTV